MRDEPGGFLMAYCRLLLWGSLGIASVPLTAVGDAPRESASTVSDNSVRQGPRRAKPQERGVGRLIGDFSFAALDGTTHKLSEFQQRKAVVFAFTNTSCPLCRKFAPTLARLERLYAERNVAFVYVNPTSSEPLADLTQAITTQGFSGPYVRDNEGAVARALRATHSTDVFVLDSRRTLAYRGAIDDQYGFGYSREAPREEFLVDALESVLHDRPVEVPATDAPGCPLGEKSERSKPSTTSETPVTFHNRISRLMQQHCVECHRKGGVAPFALDNYTDVVGHAATIRNSIERGVMPPWFAARGAPGEPTRWSNDPTLAPQDQADLFAWLENGTPEGEPVDAPLPRATAGEWRIGNPDRIFQIPRPLPVKASGRVPYHDIIVETGLSADQWVQGVEIQPTAPEVVHHVLVFVLPPGASGNKTPSNDQHLDQTVAFEQRGYFAAYVPGNGSFRLPEGYAKLLPVGSRLWFQIHYEPNGTATEDQTRMGVVFASEPPRFVVQVKGANNPRLSIPPGAENHSEIGYLRLATDIRLMSFMPHMHLRGKAFRYEALLPDGKIQLLLEVPRYDPNWQLTYRLAEPIDLPKGAVIRATGWFDNSRNNPANPDPSRTVRWGQMAEEEMLVGYIEFYPSKPRGVPVSTVKKVSSPPRKGPGRTVPAK
jgi:thiol-disulfide isomerase/thioredoxin/mono/diheme cytochrome c family protein